MGLKVTCDACGAGVAGVFSGLTKQNGKYLCKTCMKNPDGVAQYYCTSCQSYSAHADKRGSGWVELVLYLFCIIPGIIYSAWRRGGDTKVCPKCRASALISTSAGTHVKCPDCRELVLKDARKCKHCGCALIPQ
jgi:ribosomal protein S27E